MASRIAEHNRLVSALEESINRNASAEHAKITADALKQPAYKKLKAELDKAVDQLQKLKERAAEAGFNVYIFGGVSSASISVLDSNPAYRELSARTDARLKALRKFSNEILLRELSADRKALEPFEIPAILKDLV